MEDCEAMSIFLYQSIAMGDSLLTVKDIYLKRYDNGTPCYRNTSTVLSIFPDWKLLEMLFKVVMKLLGLAFYKK